MRTIMSVLMCKCHFEQVSFSGPLVFLDQSGALDGDLLLSEAHQCTKIIHLDAFSNAVSDTFKALLRIYCAVYTDCSRVFMMTVSL